MSEQHTAFRLWAEGYFGAKSNAELDALVSRFAPEIGYEDAVLGRRTVGADRMRETYSAIFAAAPEDRKDSASTLLWAVGGRGGGAVRFDNGPGLFGAPMQLIGVIEFASTCDEPARVVRQRDYWDGRAVPAETLATMRSRYPAHLPPTELGVPQRSAPEPTLAASAGSFREALDAGSALGDLLSPEVALTELSLGIRITGRNAVADYLSRASALAPYGRGARETNLVGGPQGGAWEWTAAPPWAASVGAGVIAVGLGETGRVDALTIVFDTSRLGSEAWAQLRHLKERR